MRIGIINYNAGNLKSIANAFKALNAKDVVIVDTPGQLTDCDKLVLPGVGAFPTAMDNLIQSGMVETLNKEIGKGKLFLGVCLGMQLIMDYSLEHGETQGLGWIKGGVKPFPKDMDLAIPHMGWNEVKKVNPCPFTVDLPDAMDVYFVHSFYVECDDPGDAILSCNYGVDFTAAVFRDNIMAAQFHPEKSQAHGLKMLENFMRMPC